MGILTSMGSCPFCNNGQNTACFATYSDGYHCYSCGKHKSVSSDTYAFKKPITVNKNLDLPNIITNPCHFSLNVLQWLYKYYVFEDLIRKYQISYVEKSDTQEESLVFGVNDFAFWQQRFFPSKRFITKGDKGTLFFINNSCNYIVLVEDYISAIRVGEAANTLCLFGTNLNYNMLTLIKTLNMDIKIWLDPDNAGKIASENLLIKLTKTFENCSKYRAFAVREQRTISIVETEKQPKDYCHNEIIKILEKTNEVI